MKKITFSLLFLVLLAIAGNTQVPQGINYQTVIRDGDGSVLPDQELLLKLSVIYQLPDGDIVYQEIQDVATNSFGLVNVVLGQGEATIGNFPEVDWANGPFFVQTAIGLEGVREFQVMGTSQFLSVPYAFHSNTAGYSNTAGNGIQSMTTEERDALENPHVGMQIYNTTTNCLNYWNGTNWFETCGDCTPMPSQADAGPDQSYTDSTTSTTLEANTPDYGTGFWFVESGEGGSFDDNSNHAATFTGQPCINYTLLWAISNSCGSSSDLVDVSFFDTPTAANAGSDTIVDGGVTSLTLNANTPDVGNGLWTIISGEEGIIDDATNPASLFSGITDETYSLEWAISTSCDTSADTITIIMSSLICGDTMIDTRNGNIYNIVRIGQQCWMKENLNYANGNSWCFNNDSANCDNYGRLYDWETALGVCPGGWHLPGDDELTALTDFIGGLGSPHGNQLKSCRQVNSPLGGGCNTTEHPRWNDVNSNYGTDDYGFSALPGGLYSSGSYHNLGSFGYWWSSTQNSATTAWTRKMFSDYGHVHRFNYDKTLGFSVRCLKDF